MVLLKNNTGFPVQLPVEIGEEGSIAPKQGVKISDEEYILVRNKYPALLKGLLVFDLGGTKASSKPPAAKKKSVKKSAPKAKSAAKTEAKAEKKEEKSEEVITDVKTEESEG